MATPQEEQDTARVAIRLRGEQLRQMSYEELYGRAVDITDPAEASEWFEQLVERCLAIAEPPMSRADAEDLQRRNLGYYAGYYTRETMERVGQLYGARHPFLTPEMSSEDAFEIGRRLTQGLGFPRRP